MMTSVIVLIIALFIAQALLNVKGIPGGVVAAVIIIPALWVVIDLVMWTWDHMYIKGLFWLAVIGAVVGVIGGGVNVMTETVIKHRSDERVTKVEIKKKK